MRLLQMIHSAWEYCQVAYCWLLGRNYRCGCGHTAKWKTVMTIHSRKGVYKVPSKNPDHCPRCWAKAAIKCAWCGGTILPGDAITLYAPTKSDFEVPEHAVVYKREPRLQLVGCLGWDCADTGADRAGFWVMPGRVQRVMSPLEEFVARSDGDPMIFNDLTDPRKATSMPDEDT